MTTEKEKELLALMISIYENDHHQDLSKLKEYAFKRIDCCPRKEKKLFVLHVRSIAIKKYIVSR